MRPFPIQQPLKQAAAETSNPKSGQTLLLLVGRSRAAIPDTTTFETRWRAKSRTPFPIQQPLKQAATETSNPKSGQTLLLLVGRKPCSHSRYNNL
jgi:hypothetical protein